MWILCDYKLCDMNVLFFNEWNLHDIFAFIYLIDNMTTIDFTTQRPMFNEVIKPLLVDYSLSVRN